MTDKTEHNSGAPSGALRTFGRTKGRPLSPRQQGLVDALLPRIAVPESGPVGLPERFTHHILEIGFGAGEHLVAQAKRYPDTGFIGIEPYVNGVAKALTGIEEEGLDNVRLHLGDARDIMTRIPDASLDRIYLLFPDPWPKLRHAKRRFVQDETAAEFVRLLKPGGRLRVATDVMAYADHALEVLRRRSELRWLATSADDWRKPPAGHITTRYELKRLGDCAPVWFEFERS